ncbi:MAG TPA: RodZ domain-containing protein [Thermodesulfobacteriota bacterium]|nr:RodZ domain-containing protein [Thermodesulfobacteriota bacterium]
MDERETLGKYLKNQRESKKISLREVAKNTRVREPILRALEEDQVHLLPPATYVKGFLLAYAKYLGLDQNDVLLRYERILKGESIPPPSIPSPRPKPESPPPQTSKPKQKTPWNTKQTWVVAIVIVVSFVVFYFFSPYAKRPMEPTPAKPVEEKSTTVSPPPVAARPPAPEGKPYAPEKKPLAPSAPVAATTSVQETKAISLQLKAIEETWLSAQADDQPGKEMILRPGEETTFQGSGRILMKLGNAGGVDLVLNGKSLGKFGKPGEVLNLLVTPQGVEVKRSEKPKPPKEGTSNPESQSSN